MIFFSLILLFSAGIASGYNDRIQFHWNTIKPIHWINGIVFKIWGRFPLFFTDQFWNPGESWRNKYKDQDPMNGEAFKFATTYLIFLTDGWHLLRFIQINCIILAAAIFASHWLFYFIALRLVYGVAFKITYK